MDLHDVNTCIHQTMTTMTTNRNGPFWRVLAFVAGLYLLTTLALVGAAIVWTDFAFLNGVSIGLSAGVAAWVVYDYLHGSKPRP